MSNLPLISVIVPVYNVKEYLNTCIDSICASTYNNLQIIIVNDGSTDGSAFLCDTWAKKDARVQVIHKENGGLSDARNVAFQHCTGEFIAFVDSDDVISADMFSHLYETLENNSAQISICNPAHFNSDNPKYKDCSDIITFTREEALLEMFYQKSFLMSVWGKLYQMTLFDDIEFPKGQLFEDVAVIYKIIDRCDKIVYSNAKFYGYFHRENSITNQNFTYKNCDILKICDEINNFAKDKSSDIKRASMVYTINCCFRVWLNAPRTMQFMPVIQCCSKKIKKHCFSVIFCKGSRIKLKAAILMFLFFKPFIGFVYSRVDRWE